MASINFTTLTDNTIIIPSDSLDHLLYNYPHSSLTLGKIDIEGAEMLALKGATSLLQQQRPPVSILEIDDAVNNFGYQKQDVIDLLKKYGYGVYVYNADTNQISPITLDKQRGNNGLAIADSALDFVCDRLIIN